MCTILYYLCFFLLHLNTRKIFIIEMRHRDIECAFLRIVGVVCMLSSESLFLGSTLGFIYVYYHFISVSRNVSHQKKCHE